MHAIDTRSVFVIVKFLLFEATNWCT